MGHWLILIGHIYFNPPIAQFSGTIDLLKGFQEIGSKHVSMSKNKN
jgi:hypothetical protein